MDTFSSEITGKPLKPLPLLVAQILKEGGFTVYSAYMRQRGGKIISISSGTAYSGSPNWLHYVTGKSGVLGMTRAMARELGEFRIMVNAIAPGFILTDAILRSE